MCHPYPLGGIPVRDGEQGFPPGPVDRGVFDFDAHFAYPLAAAPEERVRPDAGPEMDLAGGVLPLGVRPVAREAAAYL